MASASLPSGEQPHLENLPAELLAHIAVYCDAWSILELSRVSGYLHTVCFDGRLFRARLEHMQQRFWLDDCLDFAAIANRAGSNTQAWARYALADHCAYQDRNRDGDDINQKATSSNPRPANYAAWLPALTVVKHPVAKCIGQMLQGSEVSFRDYGFCGVVGLIIASVGSGNEMNSSGFSSGLRFAGLYLRLRRQSREHNRLLPPTQPISKYPALDNMYLEKFSDKYQLPLPFASSPEPTRRLSSTKEEDSPPAASDASRRSPSINLGSPFMQDPTWKQWYTSHVRAMCESPDFFSRGAWTGVYTHGLGPLSSEQTFYCDPLMKGIRFEPRPMEYFTNESGNADHECLLQMVSGFNLLKGLHAEDCYDAIGRFDVLGIIHVMRDGQLGFVAIKRYHERPHTPSFSWGWDCWLTPVGIVGRWGQWRTGRRSARMLGNVWIWRQEVSEGDSG